MRLLTNWKVVLTITLLFLFSMYVGILYIQDTSLPSEEWSNKLTIKSLKASKNEILLDENFYTLPLYEEEAFLTIWSKSNSIHYSVINKLGETVSEQQLDFNIYDTSKIRAINNGDTVNLLILKGKQLKRYDFNWKTSNVTYEEVMAEGVNDFDVEDNLIVLKGLDTFKIIDLDNNIMYTDNIEILYNIAITNYSNKYHFAYIKRTETRGQELEYLVYDAITGEIKLSKLHNILFNINGKVSIDVVNEEIKVIVSSYDRSSARMFGHTYTFDINDPSTMTKDLIKERGTADSIVVINNKSDKLQFIMPSPLLKGSKNKTLNLMLYSYENNELTDKELITKTKSISSNPYYFKLGDDEYVQWVDTKWEKNAGKNKEILFASTNQEIIEKSQGYDLRQWIFLILDCLISIFAIIVSASQPLLATLAPTALIITIWGSVKVYWVEQNPMKVFKVGFIIHNILKIIFVVFILLPNEEIMYSLPNVLSRLDVLVTTMVIATLIALYCTLNFSKENKHFLGSYIFYALTDMAFLSMIIYPYFAAYRMFDYLVIF